MVKYLLIIFTILTVFSTSSESQTITGKVISVADGDTITILDKNYRQTKIRLYGIDTPEKGQPFGKAAKKFTSKLTYKKQARVKRSTQINMDVRLGSYL